ncbi:MAG: GNAT family N-acetyltransferase [Hyphomicrobiaceae bacterium]|nr:GNAT family N-acetyltransferase [Hyphomicrobiaceae bacterium]
MTAARAFCQDVYALGASVSLGPFELDEAASLGAAFVAIDPWQRLGFEAERLQRFFASQDPSAARFAIRRDGQMAGFVCVNPTWLCGPYLHFLGVLPQFQGNGIGSAIVAWFVAEAQRAGDRNAWVCVSHFNSGARALYEANGFVQAATLQDLMQNGAAEILLRKVLFVQGNAAQPSEK